MAKKRLFETGDMVTAFTGQPGIVISEAMLATAGSRRKQGKRPGHYFAPGCCRHPDYVVQVPVLFEGGTYDVMRAMNIKKAPDLTDAIKSHLKGMMGTLKGQQEPSDKEEG
jgi:hypothetical protein